MRWSALSLLMKLLGGIVSIFFLVACSKDPAPVQTQAQIEPTFQQPLNTSLVASPTETSPPPPTEQKIGDLNQESQEGYPDPAPSESDSLLENQESESIPPTPGYPSPDNDLVATVPELKTELEATDPSSFNLTSGDIQLVEFFAFW
jgi:hypothetical protein